MRSENNKRYFALAFLLLALVLKPSLACPDLFEDLFGRDKVAKKKALAELENLSPKEKNDRISSLVKIAASASDSRNKSALEVLLYIGQPCITPSMRLLIDCKQAENQPWKDIVVTSGRSVIPELRAFISEGTKHQAVAAASLIMLVEPSSKEALRHIVSGIRNEADLDVLAYLMFAVGRSSVPSDSDVLLITERMDAGQSVKENALNSLANYGPKAGKAVPALIKALKKDTGYARLQELHVLGKIGEASYEAVPLIVELCKDPDLRTNACAALGEICVDPKQSLPVLEKVLGSKDDFDMAAAAESIGNFGAKAKECVPALELALRNTKKQYTIDKVLDALRKIGTEEALRVVDDFRRELRSKKNKPDTGKQGK